MTERSDDLREFLRELEDSVRSSARPSGSGPAIDAIFSALKTAAPEGDVVPGRLPANEDLPQALDVATMPEGPIKRLSESFLQIEPRLSWQRRKGSETAGNGFHDGHANTIIVGPGGLEDRGDVWVGASFMMPDVQYPKHRHPPEEIYLAVTPGEWWQEDNDWWSPGVGGLVYNTPGILHSMRSGKVPLLTFWALWSNDGVAL